MTNAAELRVSDKRALNLEIPKFSATVEGALGKVISVAEFLKQPGRLTLEDQILIVRQAMAMLQDIYVHMPLKRAMHAIDPVQRLRLLEYRLTVGPASDGADGAPAKPMEERRFHNEMTAIFTSLRDLHTVYVLPEPFQSHVAFLPFTVEEYFDHQDSTQCTYTIGKMVEGLELPPFQTGVTLKYWNGMPMQRAVELNAERNAGSNPDARHARGLETMTMRAMATAPPPDEEWVDLRYQTEDGEEHEIRLRWLVLRLPVPERDGSGSGEAGTTAAFASGLGLDLQGEILRRAKVVLLVPKVATREREMQQQPEKDRSSYTDANGTAIDLRTESILPDRINFRRVGDGRFGYLRIFSFMPPKTVTVDDFVNEVARIVKLLPENGLIVDVRGNGGGVIMAGERLLKMFTQSQIVAEPLHFLNTPLTRRLADHFTDTQRWSKSIAQAVQTGAAFSQGFPIESVDNTNRIGRLYKGPVLLITDARCYSTTDIFVAGFQDHGIGQILGTDGNTGAGGANVWGLAELCTALPDMFKPIAHRGDMTLAVRRTTRVGNMSGVPVEDLGVIPELRWKLTRRDVFENNADLIAHAVDILNNGAGNPSL